MKLAWIDHKNLGQFVAFTPFGSYIAYYGNGRSSCVCNFLAMKTCQYNTTEEAKAACGTALMVKSQNAHLGAGLSAISKKPIHYWVSEK